MKAKFKFSEGACVAIQSDNPQLGLTAGDTGIVWALYAMQPPAYEVTFRTQKGDEFDALMYEDELADAGVERPSAASSKPRPGIEIPL